jgi:uncharacterized caspase-like protein
MVAAPRFWFVLLGFGPLQAAEPVAKAGVVAFSACRGNQFAKEGLTLGHGCFTLAVTDGLEGKADLDSSSEVAVAELTLCVADRVNEFSGGQQTPWKARTKGSSSAPHTP